MAISFVVHIIAAIVILHVPVVATTAELTGKLRDVLEDVQNLMEDISDVSRPELAGTQLFTIKSGISSLFKYRSFNICTFNIPYNHMGAEYGLHITMENGVIQLFNI